MSQTHSIPRFDSTIRVKAEEDIEKQNQSPTGEGTPVVLPSGGYPSAGSAGPGLPSEGRQRTYTGSTFTQSKLTTENAFCVFIIYRTRKVLVVRFFCTDTTIVPGDSFLNSILIREKGSIRTEGLRKIFAFNLFAFVELDIL